MWENNKTEENKDKVTIDITNLKNSIILIFNLSSVNSRRTPG